MSARQAGVITIAFPDPTIPSSDNGVYEQVDPSLGFELAINNENNIQTLSSRGAADTNAVRGLLFVPEPTSRACIDAAAELVPANVTRRANLPDTDYILIGFAPHISPECTREYFEDTRFRDIRGFITYLPDNGTDRPPPPDNAVWGVGEDWSFINSPVWAISGLIGQLVITQLNAYSGNLTDVPNGRELASVYPASDYVRLYGIVQIADRNSLPSLWVFLLITLGLLILIIGVTSLSMHIIQRRRRADLRRRVVNGEVDLEALGVKRLTVPQDVLDKMPTYTYKTTAVPEIVDENTMGSSHAGHTTSFLQTTCAICLDDFIDSESTVRELPCRHVFHPDCVDTFLLNNSSLCPMCKHSTLPRGYCPATITNAMVRRERMAARYQTQPASRPGTLPSQTPASTPQASTTPSFLSRAFRYAVPPRGPDRLPIASSNRTTTANSSSNHATADIEMNQSAAQQPISTAPNTNPAPAATVSVPNEPCPDEPGQSRREWARNRAVRMLGPARVVDDADDADRRTPRWKRITRKIFPW